MALSKKHIAVIDEYFINGFNGTNAYMKVYNCSNDTARSVVTRLLTKKDIKAEIDKRHNALQKKNIITREELLQDLADIKNQQKSAFTQSALKAIEMILKMNGWNEPDKIEHSGDVKIFNIKVPGLEEDDKPTDND